MPAKTFATLVLTLAFSLSIARAQDKPAPAKPDAAKPAPAKPAAQDAAKDAAKSQDKDAKPEKNAISDFAEWAKSIEPAEHHKHLQPLVGKWNLAIKFADDDGNFVASTGTSEFKWALGNRFLLEETHAILDDKPFDWLGWHGYDNVAKKHVADFIDNYGTNIDRMEGACEKDCKVISYSGAEKLIDGREMKMRWILKIESPDKVVTEMYADHGEGEKKSMEITATRAK